MSDERGPSPRVARAIDENLRRVYDDAANEEIPDRFLNLLDQLKRGDVPGQDAGDKSE